MDSSAFFAPEVPQPQSPPPKPPGTIPSHKAPEPPPGAQDDHSGRIDPETRRYFAGITGNFKCRRVQLWRTQMLPALYLILITALLVLLWLLVKRCQEYKTPGAVSRVFSLFLCAALAVGCVWAQQGLAALDNVTSGLITGAEANKITKEPFVVYLSGVDNRGELTEKARSDVNILAVVNPETKQVALINTPRDYYVDLAGTDSKG